MKKVEKCSLNMLHLQSFNERKMAKIFGGGQLGYCGCGCQGESSVSSNSYANFKSGLTSPGVPIKPCPSVEDYKEYAFCHGYN